MKLHRFVALAAVLGALQAPCLFAQVGDTNTSPRDARFLRQAAQLGIFEFELAQLALSRTTNTELHQLGLQGAANYSTPNQDHFGLN